MLGQAHSKKDWYFLFAFFKIDTRCSKNEQIKHHHTHPERAQNPLPLPVNMGVSACHMLDSGLKPAGMTEPGKGSFAQHRYFPFY